MAKVITFEEFNSIVKANSNCEIICETRDNKNRRAFELKCECGETFIKTIGSFKKGQIRCERCAKEYSRLQRCHTYEYVNEYISSCGCKLISDNYINTDELLEITCKECGDVYKTSFYIFSAKKKHTCNKCSNKRSSSLQSFSYDYIKLFVESFNCKLLNEEYTNNLSELHIECECGKDFKTNFAKFRVMKTKGCSKCASKPRMEHRKIKYEDIKNHIEVASGSGCKLLSETCETVKDEINVLCKCGEKYTTTFTRFKDKNKTQCNKCSNIVRWDYDTVKEYVENNSKCKLVSTEYINIDSKLIFMCECGNEFKTTWDKFKSKRMKRQCNECSDRSNMEKISKQILKKYNIKFKAEKTFEGCVNPKTNWKLRYDIYIIDMNVLIECDGIQHFEVTKFHKESDKVAIKRFEEQKYKDDIKNKYAEDNGIRLIRIPYWDVDRIEEILVKELNLTNN